eukprot:g48834.t1
MQQGCHVSPMGSNTLAQARLPSYVIKRVTHRELVQQQQQEEHRRQMEELLQQQAAKRQAEYQRQLQQVIQQQTAAKPSVYTLPVMKVTNHVPQENQLGLVWTALVDSSKQSNCKGYAKSTSALGPQTFTAMQEMGSKFENEKVFVSAENSVNHGFDVSLMKQHPVLVYNSPMFTPVLESSTKLGNVPTMFTPVHESSTKVVSVPTPSVPSTKVPIIPAVAAASPTVATTPTVTTASVVPAIAAAAVPAIAASSAACDGTTTEKRRGRKPSRKESSSSRPYMCPQPGCGDSFPTQFSLKRHFKRHSGQRPFSCTWASEETGEQCTMRFAEKSTLKRHLQMHIGKRPYVCPFPNCHRRFADRINLQRHEDKHSQFSSSLALPPVVNTQEPALVLQWDTKPTRVEA